MSWCYFTSIFLSLSLLCAVCASFYFYFFFLLDLINSHVKIRKKNLKIWTKNTIQIRIIYYIFYFIIIGLAFVFCSWYIFVNSVINAYIQFEFHVSTLLSKYMILKHLIQNQHEQCLISHREQTKIKGSNYNNNNEKYAKTLRKWNNQHFEVIEKDQRSTCSSLSQHL